MTRFHVLVDNDVSPLLAETLAPLLAKDDRRATHIRYTDGLGPAATDVSWIWYLHNEPGEWMAISGNIRMTRNPAERAALRAANARILYLSRGFLAHPVHRQCAVLLWNWPLIQQTMAPLTPPVLLELGPRIQLRLKQVPL